VIDRDEGGGQTAKGGEEKPGRAVSAEIVVYCQIVINVKCAE
tara:strand:+ start:290 stop:415 length:126 start_codon:yes stop_codon:yes gene_type:complete